MAMLCLIGVLVLLFFLFSSITLPEIGWKISGAFFFTFLLADQWTTNRFLKSGRGKEGNPLLAYLFRKIGFRKTVFIWIPIAIIIIFTIWRTVLTDAGRITIISAQFLVIIWNILLVKIRGGKDGKNFGISGTEKN